MILAPRLLPKPCSRISALPPKRLRRRRARFYRSARALGGREMAVRVAINGFGRIGRLVLRAAYEHKHAEIEVVGINDLGPVETNAHLLRYDSVHGRFPGEITTGDNWMDIGRGKIRVTAERDPAKLPWRQLGVDVALECTGIFTKREAAAKHLEAGAKRVIISAPADGADMTVVMGVNQEALKPEHKVISNGSCTTNCLAPVAYVLHKGIGIERGYMTTGARQLVVHDQLPS